MSAEPTYQGNDVFVCPKGMVIHRFFMDNRDNITQWNLRKFLGLYPSDFQLYIDGINEIKSYKVIAGSIRNYCVRQLEFLKAPVGLAHVRVLQAKTLTKTNCKIIQGNYLALAQQEAISQQDPELMRKSMEYFAFAHIFFAMSM